MIRIRYFASLREALGTADEDMELETDTTVADIAERLRQRGGRWSQALAEDQAVLVAVNQEMASHKTRVNDGDEVAFFPPVTGG